MSYYFLENHKTSTNVVQLIAELVSDKVVIG